MGRLGRTVLSCSIISTTILALGILALWPTVQDSCKQDIVALKTRHGSDGVQELKSCASKVEALARDWSEEYFGSSIRAATILFDVLCPIVVDVAGKLYAGFFFVYSWVAHVLRACLPMLAKAAVAIADSRPVDRAQAFASDASEFLEFTSRHFPERVQALSAALAECAQYAMAQGDVCRLTDPSFDTATQPPEMVWTRDVTFKLYSFCMFLQEPQLAYTAMRFVVIAYALRAAKNLVWAVVRWLSSALFGEPRDAARHGQASLDAAACSLDATPPAETSRVEGLPSQDARSDSSPVEDDILGVSEWVAHPPGDGRSLHPGDGDDDGLDETKHYVWDTSSKTYVAKGGLHAEGEGADSAFLDKTADLSAASTLAHSYISNANASLGALHFDSSPEDQVCLADDAQVQPEMTCRQGAPGNAAGALGTGSVERASDKHEHERLLTRILELEAKIEKELAPAQDVENSARRSKGGALLGGLVGGGGYGLAAVAVSAGAVCVCAASAKLASSRHYVHGIV